MPRNMPHIGEIEKKKKHHRTTTPPPPAPTTSVPSPSRTGAVLSPLPSSPARRPPPPEFESDLESSLTCFLPGPATATATATATCGGGIGVQGTAHRLSRRLRSRPERSLPGEADEGTSVQGGRILPRSHGVGGGRSAV